MATSAMAQGGTGAGCDGYGVSQRWNLGGASPTRYGLLESLMAAVAALNAHGTRSYGDLVLHQILGPENGGPGISTYPGADGKTMNGRGATTPGWFRGGLGKNDPYRRSAAKTPFLTAPRTSRLAARFRTRTAIRRMSRRRTAWI